MVVYHLIPINFATGKMTFLGPQSQWWSIVWFEDNLIVVKLILILSRQMCGTLDDHGSTLFEGWTLNNIRFWVTYGESLVFFI